MSTIPDLYKCFLSLKAKNHLVSVKYTKTDKLVDTYEISIVLPQTTTLSAANRLSRYLFDEHLPDISSIVIDVTHTSATGTVVRSASYVAGTADDLDITHIPSNKPLS